MNNVNLLEMNVSDTLDVIHYFFEEDSTRYTTGEHAEATSKFRTNLYKMYDIEYAYKHVSSNSGSSDGRRYINPAINDFDEELAPVDFSNRPVKPYTPATNFNPASNMPFGEILDAPLGG